MTESNSTLRKVRLIQWALMAVIPICAWLAEIGRSRGSSDWNWRHWLVAGLAFWAVSGGFRLRHRLAQGSGEALTKDASNPKGLRQWEVGQVIGLATAEAAALWGLMIRMVLDGAFWQASLFYAAAFFLLPLWTPRMPITSASTLSAR
jgi:hypothetical protein